MANAPEDEKAADKPVRKSAAKKPAAKKSAARKPTAKKPAARIPAPEAPADAGDAAAGKPSTEEKAAQAPRKSKGLAKRILTPRLLESYLTEVVPVLTREFGYTNPMQVPRLEKLVVNIGLGEALASSGAVAAATGDLAAITGQKPMENKARISVANFKLRAGQTIGTSVTLRANRMWQFMDRLVNIALPRVRDFRGISRNSFDGRGNYSLGLREQVTFPEIDYNQIDKMRGLQITFVTTANTDEEGRRLLELLGMPYVRADQAVA